MTDLDLDTDVLTDKRTDRQLDDGGDHDRFSHYVKKKKIMSSAVEGTPLEALCGKKWVPSRDPQKFPGICTAIARGMLFDSGADHGVVGPTFSDTKGALLLVPPGRGPRASMLY